VSIYRIRKGSHYTKSIGRLFNLFGFKTKRNFLVKFDHSCFYNALGEDGDDLNKLYGFTAVGSKVHENSVRFAWRPSKSSYSSAIEIHAYWYLNGVRGSICLGKAETGFSYSYSLEITPKEYIFYFDTNKYVVRARTEKSFGVSWRLFPYFGGNNKAPHDMKIYIEDGSILL
jgi:hypothetical protein